MKTAGRRGEKKKGRWLAGAIPDSVSLASLYLVSPPVIALQSLVNALQLHISHFRDLNSSYSKKLSFYIVHFTNLAIGTHSSRWNKTYVSNIKGHIVALLLINFKFHPGLDFAWRSQD